MALSIQSDAATVRLALVTVFDAPALAALPEAMRGAAELVLAEALNNIVEHAYAKVPGTIDLRLGVEEGALVCQITDSGEPMPDGILPVGSHPMTDADNLPEGGFGWYLIRTLSKDLCYTRVPGKNVLTFRVPPSLVGQQSLPGGPIGAGPEPMPQSGPNPSTPWPQ